MNDVRGLVTDDEREWKRGKVERGGRVENERKASEEAPMG